MRLSVDMHTLHAQELLKKLAGGIGETLVQELLAAKAMDEMSIRLRESASIA